MFVDGEGSLMSFGGSEISERSEVDDIVGEESGGGALVR